MMKLNSLASNLLAWSTAFLNWLVFYGIARAFDSAISFEIATMLAGGLVIHEYGHKLAMNFYGIRAHLIFLVILGGASPDYRDKQRYERLDYQKKSVIYFAGVIGNFIAMLIGLILYHLDPISYDIALRNVNLNAILVFYNIFPIWITDGGRFAKLFFDSTPEHMDQAWIYRIGIPIAMAAIFITIITPEFFLVTITVMFWGLHFQATHDDPDGCFSPLALNKPQRHKWAIFYLALFISSMYILGVTPNWIHG